MNKLYRNLYRILVNHWGKGGGRSAQAPGPKLHFKLRILFWTYYVLNQWLFKLYVSWLTGEQFSCAVCIYFPQDCGNIFSGKFSNLNPSSPFHPTTLSFHQTWFKGQVEVFCKITGLLKNSLNYVANWIFFLYIWSTSESCPSFKGSFDRGMGINRINLHLVL